MKKIIYLFVMVALISGCMTRTSVKDVAKEKLGFVSYGNTQYEEKPDISPVDLFYDDAKPSKPYDVIGEISGQVDDPRNAQAMLEVRTRQVGGDGAMNINIKTDARIETREGTGYYDENMPYVGSETIRTNDVKAKIIRYK